MCKFCHSKDTFMLTKRRKNNKQVLKKKLAIVEQNSCEQKIAKQSPNQWTNKWNKEKKIEKPRKLEWQTYDSCCHTICTHIFTFFCHK